MTMMVNRDRARPKRVRKFTAATPAWKKLHLLPVSQVGDTGRGDEVADVEPLGDDQLVIAHATHVTLCFLTVELALS